MLVSTVAARLTPPAPGAASFWQRWVARRPRAEQTLTLGAVPLLTGLEGVFRSMKLTDVVCLWLNGSVAFLDTENNQGDLAVAFESARRPTGDGLESLRVLINRPADIHTIVDAHVSEGAEPTLTIGLCSRVPALRPRGGELAGAFLERIREVARTGEILRTAQHQHDELTKKLVSGLRRAGAMNVGSEPTRFSLVRPELEEMMWFRKLRFGRGLSAPRYRPAPARASGSGHRDPFSFFYFDPYHRIAEWALVDALHTGEYAGPNVAVCGTNGELLYNQSDAPGSGAHWLGKGVVTSALDGLTLVVADVVPHMDTLPKAVAARYRPDFVPDETTMTDPRLWEVHEDRGFTAAGFDVHG
jgi:hypothetical protein